MPLFTSTVSRISTLSRTWPQSQGTLVNGRRIKNQEALYPGSQIRLGDTTLLFQRNPDRLELPGGTQEPLIDTNRWLLTAQPVAFISPERLSDRSISAPHAFLEVRENAIVVRDLNSTQGTFLHGRRIQGDTTLVHDDLLRLGNVEFEVNSGFDYMPEEFTDKDGDLWVKEVFLAEGGMARLYRYASKTNLCSQGGRQGAAAGQVSPVGQTGSKLPSRLRQ